MTYAEVIEIFQNTPHRGDNQRFAFREGIKLLFDLDYESDDVACRDDQIWYGSPERILDKLTPEICTYLAERGWCIDDGSFNFWP